MSFTSVQNTCKTIKIRKKALNCKNRRKKAKNGRDFQTNAAKAK